MAYGREMLGKALRKAGDIDARYAQAVDNRFGFSKSGTMLGGIGGLTSAVPAREFFNNPKVSGIQPEGVKEHLMQGAYDGAVAATNLAARYALPAGGVTAAGVGLYELSQALTADQQSSGTVMP